MATIAQQVQHTSAHLAAVAGEGAALEARMLVQHVLGISRESMLRDWQQPVADAAVQKLDALVARRLRHEPVSQILGQRDFWKDSFLVTADVLTPRPDSETLIEALLRHQPDRTQPYRILDLGTGSGALLLSALREYTQAEGVAVDLSPAALAVARRNAERLGLAGRVAFREGSWCNPLDSADKFAIVVSNPPYIARAEIAALDEDVKGYEPHLALDGGDDGLSCYRAIFSTIRCHLLEGAWLLVEVGRGQAEDVAALGVEAGLLHQETCNDLAGIARVVCFTNQRNEQDM